MASLTLESPGIDIRPEPPAPARLVVVPDPVDDLDLQRRVEARFFRAWGIGMLVGAVVGAAVWCGLVAVALAGGAEGRGAMMLTGAACGVFAGIFLGGWAGAVVGASYLEHHEHATRPSV